MDTKPSAPYIRYKYPKDGTNGIFLKFNPHRIVKGYCFQQAIIFSLYIPVDIIQTVALYFYLFDIQLPQTLAVYISSKPYVNIQNENEPNCIAGSKLGDDEENKPDSKKRNAIKSIKRKLSSIKNSIKRKQSTNNDIETIKYKAVEQIKYKMIILGTGWTGKSTILKQLRQIYGRQFDEAEFLAAKPHLTQNVIEAMRTLAIYSDILGDQGKNTKVSDENKQIRHRVARMSDKQKFTKEHYEDFVKLWMDEGIQNTLQHSNEFWFMNTAPYLFENMNAYWKDEYIPTFKDLIHSRQRTTGVNKIKFVLPDKYNKYEEIYEIFDVGGAKNERLKWMHFFDNICGVLYCVDLSSYCKLLWEDNRNNRMKESIGLFRGVVNLDVFKESHIFVLFTYFHDFLELIKHVDIKKRFNDFTKNSQNERDIIQYFVQKFVDQIRQKKENNEMCIHFIVMDSINTLCVKRTFEYIRVITKKELDQKGFL